MNCEFPVDLDTGVALTSMQASMLAESNAMARPWLNLEQIVVHFGTDAVDPQRIRAAWQALVGRFDALSLHLDLSDPRSPVQRQIHLGVLPMVSKTLTAQQNALEEFLTQDRQRGLDLSSGPAWRVTLLSDAQADPRGGDVMVVTLHHAIADGRSMARLIREFLCFLQTGELPQVQPDASSFLDAIEGIAQLTAHSDEARTYFETALKNWEDAGALSLPQLGQCNPVAQHKRQISKALTVVQTAQLTQLAEHSGGTLANLVQAAWGLVLARWQGRADVGFGVVRSGRHAVAGSAQTVGCLINTLPMRIAVSRETTLAEIISQLRADTKAMHRYEQTPLADMRKWVGLHGAQPLFDTAIMFERASLQSLATTGPGAERVRNIELREEGGLPLMLAVYAEDAMQVMLEHDETRISPALGEKLLNHLTSLLAAMAGASPETKLRDLDMLSAEERAELHALARPDQPLDMPNADLLAGFAQSVLATPNAAAIECVTSGQHLTYMDLDRRANGMAHRLAAQGVQPGQIVAISLPRGPDFIVAMLAILKCGAAFLPVDPSYPAESRLHMFNDSGAVALIGEGGPSDLAVICQNAPPMETGPSLPPISGEELAYVIYTSGSTGLPKGVQVTRNNLLAHITALSAAFEMTPDDRSLQFASLSFDVALEEIFTTLSRGATLVLRSDKMAQSASAFLTQIAENRVSVLNIPTAFWGVLTQFMHASGQHLPQTVRLIVVGGERIPPATLADWRHIAPDLRFLNGYGPTETTITCTLFEAGATLPDGEVPIGRPTAQARTHILAADGSLAPRGATGELAIGGPGVSLGYIGAPEKTAQAFVPDSFSTETDGAGRLYLSGDRAHWRSDRMLGFEGRRDRQVKLRGFRIDLGQVEHAIARLTDHIELRVDVIEPNTPKAQLVAWCASESPPDMEQLRAGLAKSLPAHMQPSLVHLKQFPRTAGGKIDEKALPRPKSSETTVPTANGTATELECKLQAAMAHVLGRDEVGLDQSFFDLGGHSLLSVALIGRIELETGKPLGLVDFHNNPTPRQLAALLETGSTASKHIVPIQPEGTRPVLFGVHILGAKTGYFGPLSHYLGPDQPIMGVSVGSLDADTPTGIEATAARYCADINRHHPDGPIHLMAVSLGAYMAFELAHQLKASGREVGMIALFDAAGPGGRHRVQGWRKFVAHFKKARDIGWGYPAQILNNRIFNLRNRLASLRMKRKTEDVETHAPTTVYEFIAANEIAVNAYQPKPLDLPLTIFRSQSNFFDTSETIANGLGWAPVAPAGFEVIDVPGGHLSLLQEPHAPVMAAEFARVLDAWNADYRARQAYAKRLAA